ncbi:hypothetical protein BAUCODRAFT_80277 [Baudoinia panamericana UAMH 10762]|uniref:HCNGP-like protein n=1 Tax=Baudoinia panamericana (strain UAMH 10762) TaxID=717646 RepID=M2M3V0_BAUPA|nr:uncharacterized protein BAUCODRAFT_80277 [Baudoinia panamericana UAMH 10762]EMC91251.1 hypothetical protein BAUCODRAFT_80277 [Baudoinia panamericana UAMH 10762]
MSALVGYASSDEDEDEYEGSSRPAKIATKHESQDPTEPSDARAQSAQELPSVPIGPSLRPHQPHPDVVEEGANLIPSSFSPPSSPYTFERQRVRELTMPPIPNFSIPEAPLPPLDGSEEAAALSAATKKFSRFLELKKQGIHFNERLLHTSSLRNPGLLPKLMEFAGIGVEESYATTLSTEGGEGAVAGVRWPEEWYVENLIKENERKLKNERERGGKLEFVPAANAKASNGSAVSTPGSSGSGGGGRKSRFDRR